MSKQAEALLHGELSQVIIGSFYEVYNQLGYGFLERVYEAALAHELTKRGLNVERQAAIRVYYDSQVVGEFFADLLVENCIIIELKAAESIHPRYEAQLLNYLKATDIEVGLLLNFGPEASFKRKVFTNVRKKQPAKIKKNPLQSA